MADLTQDVHNVNVGSTRGRMLVEHSVHRYGFGRSVLADRQGRLIAGNKTVEAAVAAGRSKVTVVQTTGDELVVVQRTDLDLDEAPAQELAVADNRANEVGLVWDPAGLQRLDESGADLKQFWREPEWANLMESEAIASVEELPEMAVQPFEHHDYIMVVFKDSHAWTRACDTLGIKRTALQVGGRRKIGLGRVITGEQFLEVLDAAATKKAKRA